MSKKSYFWVDEFHRLDHEASVNENAFSFDENPSESEMLETPVMTTKLTMICFSANLYPA